MVILSGYDEKWLKNGWKMVEKWLKDVENDWKMVEKNHFQPKKQDLKNNY